MNKPINRKSTTDHNKDNKTVAQPTFPKEDIYTRITNKILGDLENGDLTWRKPWNSDNFAGQVMRPLRWNNIPYTGINTLMLWSTAAENGYSSRYWMTFKQATDLKANVRKGEKGTQVVYADTFTKEEQGSDGALSTRQVPFLKSYTVFNASQIEGLSDAFYQVPERVSTNPQQRNSELETFFAQTRADIYTGHQANYIQSSDRIQMPPFECFDNAASFYAVLAHEVTHNAAWKIMPHRTGLPMIKAQFRYSHAA
ncbi:ArdC family protein [Spirosoma arboris]|uniref:ArdC family protein n=1 Tax=Spirosoma arboris TaxID=2682092 RepID=UPI001D11DCAA|nr:ArdC-like ssDNA-binding domain-containing protein [Spirosoma arboris]